MTSKPGFAKRGSLHEGGPSKGGPSKGYFCICMYVCVLTTSYCSEPAYKDYSRNQVVLVFVDRCSYSEICMYVRTYVYVNAVVNWQACGGLYRQVVLVYICAWGL